jgi:hypothetical protein
MANRKLYDVSPIASVSYCRPTRLLRHSLADGHLAVGNKPVNNAVLVEVGLGDQHADDVGARGTGRQPALSEDI